MKFVYINELQEVSELSNSENIRDWLLKHPVEAVFIEEITKNVNDIYQHLTAHPNLKEDETKEIKFQVIKRHETDYVELAMSPNALFFLGGMAKAISDIILKQLLPNAQIVTLPIIK